MFHLCRHLFENFQKLRSHMCKVILEYNFRHKLRPSDALPAGFIVVPRTFLIGRVDGRLLTSWAARWVDWQQQVTPPQQLHNDTYALHNTWSTAVRFGLTWFATDTLLVHLQVFSALALTTLCASMLDTSTGVSQCWQYYRNVAVVAALWSPIVCPQYCGSALHCRGLITKYTRTLLYWKKKPWPKGIIS